MSVAKATAAMTSNTAPPKTPSNMEAQREGFFDQCQQFGTNAGAGDTSKVGWFQATCEAAWQGIVAPSARRKKGDTTTPPGDAEVAYKRFADARQKKAGELGKRLKGFDGKDTKTRISEAAKMIELGSLPVIHDENQGGLGVFNRTLKMIRDDEEITGQVDDLLLEVARRQCDAPNKLLSDDQIHDILLPDDHEEKPPTPEVELWGNVLRQIESIMNKKFPDTSGTSQDAKTARSATVRQIDKLGGTAAMVAAREKAQAKAAKDKAARQVQRQGARKGGKKK
jgi:hypothetical protein